MGSLKGREVSVLVRNTVKVSHRGDKAVINELELKCYGSAPCYNKTTWEDSRVQEASSPGVDVLHRRGSSDLAVCVRALTIFFSSVISQSECIPAAVRCVVAELEGVVKTECEDPGKYVEGALDFWDSVQHGNTLGNSGDEVSTSPSATVCEDDKTSFAVTKPTCLSFGTQMTASNCQCELWPKTPFHTFLNAAESLIQAINTQAQT